MQNTIAEAKFLRSYFYLELVKFFENVPLLTATIKGPDEYAQEQNSPEEVYNQIALDLVEAIAGQIMPVISGDMPGILIRQLPETEMPEHLRVFGLFRPNLYCEDTPITYIHPDLEVGTDTTALLQHDIAFGGLVDVFRKGNRIDTRMLQWKGNQWWLWRRIQKHWLQMQDPNYCAEWWLHQWVNRDHVPWVRLNSFYDEVTFDTVGVA